MYISNTLTPRQYKILALHCMSHGIGYRSTKSHKLVTGRVSYQQIDKLERLEESLPREVTQ